jgi:hypothetical protein
VGFLQVTGDPVREVVISEGKPAIYTMQEDSGFFEQVGNNTRYIIHPEEILADNFSYAVLGKTGLPNQEIVEEMKGMMQKERR